MAINPKFPITPPNGPKWNPSEIADWVKAEHRYQQKILGEAYWKFGREAENLAPKVANAGTSFLKTLGGASVNAIANILLNPEPVGQGEAEYLYRLSQLRNRQVKNNPTTTVDNNPIISEGPTVIYEYEQGPTRYVIIPPPRRLKPLTQTPDTARQQDEKSPVISVEQAFSVRKWGSILHEPIYNKTLEVKAFNYDSIESYLKDELKDSEKKFNEWLLLGKPTTIDRQSIVLIDAIDYTDRTRKLDAFCGIRSLQMLYDSYFALSKNAIRPLTTMIPKEVKTKDVSLPIGKYESGQFNIKNTRGGLANRVAGVDTFPIIVPEDITAPKEQQKEASLNNIAELGAYLIKMVDSISGQYPIEIEIEDSNATQVGDQKAKITLPNQAEAIAELIGLTFTNHLRSQLLVDLTAKTAVIATKGLISSTVAQDIARQNSEYLGYKRKEITRDIGIPLNPNSETFEKMLEPTTQKYETIELTDEKDLNDYLFELLQAASIIKGAFTRRFNMNDAKGAIKKHLQSLLDNASGGQLSDEDWIKFLNKVENGFIDENLTDKVHPYGNNYEQRPKVRDVNGK